MNTLSFIYPHHLPLPPPHHHLSLSLSPSLSAMSVIHEKTPKHCAEKQATTLHKLNKKLLFYISTFFLTILSLILLIWFTLHPRNPHFSLKQADISHLNSSIHLTLLSTNPNNKVGIFYDGFLIHASYNAHTIASQTSIPSFYQHHEESNLLTASFPLNPHLAYQALHDQATRKLALDFKVTGKLRWKLGSWISRRYQFKVDCASHELMIPKLCSTSIN